MAYLPKILDEAETGARWGIFAWRCDRLSVSQILVEGVE
jgi:hypothetical protein